MNEQKIKPGDWIRAGDAIYEMMHSGWLRGEEQLKNRIGIQFTFDKTVSQEEREHWMKWIERAIQLNLDIRSDPRENVIHPKPNRYS
jgi:hypothetical protein